NEPVAAARAATVTEERAASTTTAVLEAPAPPASDAALEAQWLATVDGVNEQKRMLGAFLQACRFDGATDAHVVLAMDDLHRAVVDEKENRGIIARVVARTFGRPLAVRCVALEGGAPAPRTSEDVRPLIDRAIAWFEGDIIEPGGASPAAGASERTGP
ncbi:MAG TPA: hypothetical protein VJY35_07200, partial [Candidatus Eisenbacteria bacterium]|nr:hypothetical protein [Candidatus Eisenbacteria bacterium]